jgi:hypothetical protein
MRAEAVRTVEAATDVFQPHNLAQFLPRGKMSLLQRGQELPLRGGTRTWS